MNHTSPEFNNAYEQIVYLIKRYNFNGGYIGAGGMGYEYEIDVAPDAPEWARNNEDMIAQLSSIDSNEAEFSKVALRKVGKKIQTCINFSSSCADHTIEDYPEFSEEVKQLLKIPEGAELPDCNEWEQSCWNGTHWESLNYYDPGDDDTVEINMSKTRSLKLYQLVKRYLPTSEKFKSIAELELYTYKGSGKIRIKSATTKWADITDQLQSLAPY